MPLAENDSLSGLLIADTSRHSVIKRKKKQINKAC